MSETASEELRKIHSWEYKLALMPSLFECFRSLTEAYVRHVLAPAAGRTDGVRWKEKLGPVEPTMIQFFDTGESHLRNASYLVRWRCGGGCDNLTLKHRDADVARAWDGHVGSAITIEGKSADGVSHKREVLVLSGGGVGTRSVYALDNEIDARSLGEPLPTTMAGWARIFPSLAALAPAGTPVSVVCGLTVQQLQRTVGYLVLGGKKRGVEAKVDLALWLNATYGANPYARFLAAELSYAFGVAPRERLRSEVLAVADRLFEHLQSGDGAHWLDREGLKTDAIYEPPRAARLQ